LKDKCNAEAIFSERSSGKKYVSRHASASESRTRRFYQFSDF